MDNLWAPWRKKYILQNKKKTACLFCDILKAKKDNRHYVFLKTNKVFSLLNIYPYNNGHIMVVPKRHIDKIEKLTASEWEEIHQHLSKITVVLRKSLKAQAFNLGINLGKIAGAGVDKHLHVHLVPRWAGDTNFMPVVAKTKVISQSLDDLYQLLRKGLKNL